MNNAQPPRRPSAATIPSSGWNESFSEVSAWEGVGRGWQHLHGSFRELGFSLEWHDFQSDVDFDWSRSFHPEGLEICLNLSGHAEVADQRRTLALVPQSAGFYARTQAPLRARRRAGERHQFITLELSREFIGRHISLSEPNLHPSLAEFLVAPNPGTSVSPSEPLTMDLRTLVMGLRNPPILAAAQRLWYHAKALEIASRFLYQAPPDQALFCQRHGQLNQDRANRVVSLLRKNLAEPPNLEALARNVGCSPYYLSRVFTQQLGQTISQCLRQLRMEKAAMLLLEGRLSVTAIALEVGYSSPSHFSTAFHETFGCCPGLYALQRPSRKPCERAE